MVKHLFFFGANQANGAPTIVSTASNSTTSGNSVQVSISAFPKANGNRLLLCAAVQSDATPLFNTPSQSGVIWTQVATSVSAANAHGVEWWYSDVISGSTGNVVTVAKDTPAVSADMAVIVAEVSGLPGSISPTGTTASGIDSTMEHTSLLSTDGALLTSAAAWGQDNLFIGIYDQGFASDHVELSNSGAGGEGSLALELTSRLGDGGSFDPIHELSGTADGWVTSLVEWS